jgi:hypothetical protein
MDKMMTDNVGNVYAVATVTKDLLTNNALVVKLDANGNKLWQQIDTGFGYTLGTVFSRIYDACLDDTRDVYIVGSAYLNGGRVGYIAKYNTNGVFQWRKVVSYGSDTTITVRCIAMLNNYLYVAAYLPGANNVGRLLLQKYNTNGNVEWSTANSFSNAALSGAFSITSRGNTIAVMKSAILNLVSSHFIAAYDTSGSLKWYRTGDMGLGRGTAIDSKGNVLALINTDSVNVIKYDTAGNTLWQRGQPAGYAGAYRRMIVAPDDNVYLCGESSPVNTTERHFVLTGMFPNGTERFYSLGYLTFGSGWDLDLLTANDIIVSARVDSAGVSVLNFDSTGAVKWNIEYTDNEPMAYCKHVQVDSFGNILLGGTFRLGAYSPIVDTMALQVMKYGNAVSTGINTLSSDAGIQLYPNPAGSVLYVKADEHINPAFISVYDINGRLLLQEPFNESLNVASLCKGLYVLEIRSNSGSARQLFIKD